MKRILTAGLASFFLLVSNCDSRENDLSGSICLPQGNGIFIANEGNFMWGNGSVSFFSFDSLKIYNDIFSNINGRPPGDVLNFIAVHDNRAFIVVNNSNKIEVVDCFTFKTTGVITGLVSPRQICFINDSEAYVSSLYSTKISVVDINGYNVKRSIETGKTTEAMVLRNGRVYVSSWAGGNEVLEINILTHQVTGSVTVGREPESMVFDNSGLLWVLCTGGYSGEFFPEISVVDPQQMSVIKTFMFPSKQAYPSSLVINCTGDTLYYIDQSVWMMPVNSAGLPQKPFISASGRTFYRIAREPFGGRLFVTNALDYQKKGFLLIADSRGIITDSARTGIIPGNMCFRYRNR